MKKEDQARSLLGISLTDKPIWQQFLICSSGFFFGYLVNGICEGFTTKQMVNPWKTYVKLSAVLMGSHGLTKGSLAYLNYPAQIMFKYYRDGDGCVYPRCKHFSNFSVIGIVMILGALVMDAFLDGDAILLNGGRFAVPIATHDIDRRVVQGMEFFILMYTACWFLKRWLHLLAKSLFCHSLPFLELPPLLWSQRQERPLHCCYRMLDLYQAASEQHGSGLIPIAMGIVLKLVLESKPPSRVVTPDSTSTRGNSYSKEVNNRGKGNGDGGEEDEEKRPLV
ncbi:hypothetical protein DH2020_028717 [Rehmannia glutinosa]|uniref:Uncharacterized protein n=1 Tax=Rehmannia glutinosa TaxID=99300 RepID=A0ABR0VTD5_REHGL